MRHHPRLRRLTGTALLVLSSLPLAAGPRGIRNDGTEIEGWLGGTTPTRLRLIASPHETHPLQQFNRILWPLQPRDRRTGPALRRLCLWGGDVVTGTLGDATADRIDVDLGVVEARTIDLAHVAAVASPPGRMTVFWDDFEAEPAGWTPAELPLDGERARSGKRSWKLATPGQSFAFQPPQPIGKGRVELGLCEAQRHAAGAGWYIELEYSAAQEEPASRIRVEPEGNGYRVRATDEITLTEQRVRWRPGWHVLAVDADESRSVVTLDGGVIAHGSAPAGAFRGLRVGRPPAEQAGTPVAPLWVDDLLIEARLATPSPRREQRTQDYAILASDDELYGKFAGTTARQLLLQAGGRERSLPWTAIGEMRFARRPASPRAISGWISRIELQPVRGDGIGEADRMIAAVQAADDEHLTLEHAALGRLELPTTVLRRVEPIFAGTLLAIEPATWHLGDEIREDFECPLPDGARLERDFVIEPLPPGKAYISLEVEHLEPAGKRTPAGTPFLDQLRAGHLRTELWINSRKVDDLNRWAISRAPIGRPLRLRIPVSAGIIKEGVNTLRLSQRPSRDDPQNFDDLCVSRIALEIEAP